jgi:hypothetical protein
MKKECGAKARTNGHKPCRRPAMANGRCRLHGGLSTGAKSPEGKQRASLAVLKHGYYTQKAILERRVLRKTISHYQNQLNNLSF